MTIRAATAEWLVVCTKRDGSGKITHIGVDVPRGTQHVPLEEALASIAEGKNRFYVDVDGDLLVLRPDGAGLRTSRDQLGAELLASLPDCGNGRSFVR